MSVQSQQVSITSPCPITLDRSQVTPGDRRLFCGHCTKDVHLLSQMTESEARTFMQEHAGQDICVSYAIKSDGAIRFRPEPPPAPIVPVSALRRRPSRARTAALGAVGAMMLAACAPHTEPESIQVGDDDTALQIIAPTIPIADPDVIPCDDGRDVVVDGGLVAEPIVAPPPEPVVAGGLRAEPIEEEPPLPAPIKRGKIKASPL